MMPIVIPNHIGCWSKGTKCYWQQDEKAGCIACHIRYFTITSLNSRPNSGINTAFQMGLLSG